MFKICIHRANTVSHNEEVFVTYLWT